MTFPQSHLRIGSIGSARCHHWIWFWCCAFALASAPLAGCSPTPFVWAKDIPAERAKPEIESNTLGRGDVISISIVGQAALSGTQTVGADGTINVPNVGSYAVVGLTVEQASAGLELHLSKIFQTPKVSVLVVTRFLEVSILGEVESPGKYLVQSGDGVANALAMAGGITEFGSPSEIYLVRASEPQRVRFRMRDLLRGGDSARSFALRDGDILVVE